MSLPFEIWVHIISFLVLENIGYRRVCKLFLEISYLFPLNHVYGKDRDHLRYVSKKFQWKLLKEDRKNERIYAACFDIFSLFNKKYMNDELNGVLIMPKSPSIIYFGRCLTEMFLKFPLKYKQILMLNLDTAEQIMTLSKFVPFYSVLDSYVIHTKNDDPLLSYLRILGKDGKFLFERYSNVPELLSDKDFHLIDLYLSERFPISMKNIKCRNFDEGNVKEMIVIIARNSVKYNNNRMETFKKYLINNFNVYLELLEQGKVINLYYKSSRTRIPLVNYSKEISKLPWYSSKCKKEEETLVDFSWHLPS